MITPGLEGVVRPQPTQSKTKPTPREETAADVFAANSSGTLETLASRSQITGFNADHKLSTNMRSGTVSIESPALGKTGRLELSQVLWISKAVLVVNGQRQELPLSKMPSQGDWDYGGFQAELPNGKQLEIRSCLIHSEAFARRFGVEMTVSEPSTDASITLSFRDHLISRDLNGQAAKPIDATAKQGQSSISYQVGSPELIIQSGDFSATARGATEKRRTDHDNGSYSISWNVTDQFPHDRVTAAKSSVTGAIDRAFLQESAGPEPTQPIVQSALHSPILMSIYGYAVTVQEAVSVQSSHIGPGRDRS